MLKINIAKLHGFFIQAKNRSKKIGGDIGPGFVTGAADDDPSGIGTYSIAGAKYGLSLAWLIPFQLPLMFTIQEMCARIGLVSGKGLAANMKKYFAKPFLFLAIFALIFANIINISADISIMSSSVKLIIGGNTLVWAILITIAIVLLEIFISYHVYSKILIWLSFFLLAYVFTAFTMPQDWLEILKFTFIPHFQYTRDFILVGAGFIGTTISPYLFFWQASQEIEERLDHDKRDFVKKSIQKVIKRTRINTFVGTFFSQLITFFIVITCFASLHKSGITEINTAYDAALALKPLAGDWASLIFTLGIIGAGLLGIPVLAGSAAYAMAEIFDHREGLDYKFNEAKFFYGTIAISTFLGLIINFIDISPMKALLYAAIVNSIAALPIIVFVLILANKKELMGSYKNGFLSNFFGAITLAMMFLSAILVTWFF